MKEFIAGEIRFLLWSIGCGLAMGMVHRGLAVFRMLVPHHWLMVGAEDVLYWLCSAVLMFAVILVANDGTVRSFAIAGMIAGMIISAIILKYLGKGITILYRRFRKGTKAYEGKHRKTKAG